jgi:hypothetical protein
MKMRIEKTLFNGKVKLKNRFAMRALRNFYILGFGVLFFNYNNI